MKSGGQGSRSREVGRLVVRYFGVRGGMVVIRFAVCIGGQVRRLGRRGRYERQ